jgi:hypothetical protein
VKLQYQLKLIIIFCLIYSGCSNKTTITNYTNTNNFTNTKQLGVASRSTSATSIAIDSSANVYTTGWTDGGLDGNTLIGLLDLFVTKYNSNGVKLWTKQLGGGPNTSALALALDSSAHLYVTGWTDGGLDGNALIGLQDFFVTKFDTNGTKLWTRQLGVASASTSASGIATDTAANVYITGWTTGNLDTNTLIGSRDYFITKYDTNGTKQWTKQLGVAAAITTASGITTDAAANIYITGSTYGSLDSVPLTGVQDLFLTKYNSSGVKQWTKLMGVSAKNTQANAIASDSAANIYVTGFTTGALSGNTQTGTHDIFIAKFDTNGTIQWSKQMGAAGTYSAANGITTDTSANIYLTGLTYGGLNGNFLTGILDLFVAKYNTSGIIQWTTQLGVAGLNTTANGIALDTANNAYVAGWSNGGLDYNTLMGIQDLIVAKYNSSGVKY